MRLQLNIPDIAAAGTTTSPSVESDLVKGFAASLNVSGFAGTGTPSVTVTIQHAPENSRDVADAAATWYDLTTFTQHTANATEFKAQAGPNFGRLRLKVVAAGTTIAAHIDTRVEGERRLDTPSGS